jgi:hypothetical protein
VILVFDEPKLLEDVASGRCCCPCGGRLRTWGRARVRLIRQLDGSHTEHRPRRLACETCRRTQVLLPAWSLPRRRDSVETVGAALVMAVEGRGHRTIAAELDRPESTVRNWLRRARMGAERLRQAGVVAAHDLEPGHGPMKPRATALAEAVDALGVAASAAVRRFGLVGVSPWRIIAMLSNGELLAGLPAG